MFDSDSAADLIDRVSAGARAESSAIAGRLAAIGALDSLREHELVDSILWTTDPFEEVAAEISAALRISRGRAGTQIHHARVLRDKLPLVAARFAAGDIDYRIVRMIIARTGTVDPAVWSGLDEELAARAHRWMRLSENQLRDRVDQWIAKLDPNGVRVPPNIAEERFVQIEAGSPGKATVWAHVDAVDGAALDQRLDALAHTVCEHDPRTHAQRRADAIGPLARLQSQLSCRCGSPDCPAAQKRAAANAAMVHVLANESTLDGTTDDPGYLPGYGILPAESVRNLAANARRKPVVVPTEPAAPAPASAPVPENPADTADPAKPSDINTADTEVTATAAAAADADADAAHTADNSNAGAAEPQYRPSMALSEFIRFRDLACRFPGCDAPVERCDIDRDDGVSLVVAV